MRARFRLKFPLRVRCQVPQRWKQGAAGVCGLSYKMSMCLNGDCRRTIKQYHFVFAVVTLSSDSKQLIPPGCLVQLILCKPQQPCVLSQPGNLRRVFQCRWFQPYAFKQVIADKSSRLIDFVRVCISRYVQPTNQGQWFCRDGPSHMFSVAVWGISGAINGN